jgi:15-cis-phytoene synthase
VQRHHLFALYAFDLEIRRIRDVVSEPQIGEIRQQWWLDSLDGIFGAQTPDHPVAQSLARAIEKNDLPKHALRNLIIAHEFDFYSDPMPNLTALEGYLGETSSSIIQLASLILAGEEALGSAAAAGLAGVAHGMTRLLSRLPEHRARQQCFIPEDYLKRRQTTVAEYVAGQNHASLSVVLAELRLHARKRLAEARNNLWLIPKAALPAYLPVALTELYLSKLDTLDARALDRPPQVSQIMRQLKLWRMAGLEQF